MLLVLSPKFCKQFNGNKWGNINIHFRFLWLKFHFNIISYICYIVHWLKKVLLFFYMNNQRKPNCAVAMVTNQSTTPSTNHTWSSHDRITCKQSSGIQFSMSLTRSREFILLQLDLAINVMPILWVKINQLMLHLAYRDVVANCLVTMEMVCELIDQNCIFKT